MSNLNNKDFSSKIQSTVLEERIIQALSNDNGYADQMSEVIEPKYFTKNFLQNMALEGFKYHAEYRSFPSIPVLESIMFQRPNDNEVLQKQYRAFFDRIREHPLVRDLDWLKKDCLDFCKRQKLLIAIEKCLTYTEERNYESIVQEIQKAVSAGSDKDVGHVYEHGLDERMIEAHRMPVATPWPAVNGIVKGGVSAGELAVVLALTGVGKSHVLVDVGAAAALNGKNVVHFTFELSELKVGKRYDARISGIEYDHLAQHKEYVQECIEKMPGKVRIKKYPNRKATVQTIRNYVTKLKNEGVKPDLLVVDYADIMKSGKSYENKRFEEEAVYEELRSLADELAVPIWTASQTNRGGMDVEVLTFKHIAECFAKANISDLFITMNRKKTGANETIGNFFVAKSRLGADGVKFNILVNTALSRIKCLTPGSDEEKQAVVEYDLNLTDQERVRRRIESMREDDNKPTPANVHSLQQYKKENNLHGEY